MAGFRGKQKRGGIYFIVPFIDEIYLPFASGLEKSEISFPAGLSNSSGLHLHCLFLEVDLSKIILAFVASMTITTFQTNSDELISLQQQHLGKLKLQNSIWKAFYSHMTIWSSS